MPCRAEDQRAEFVRGGELLYELAALDDALTLLSSRAVHDKWLVLKEGGWMQGWMDRM